MTQLNTLDLALARVIAAIDTKLGTLGDDALEVVGNRLMTGGTPPALAIECGVVGALVAAVRIEEILIERHAPHIDAREADAAPALAAA